MLILTSTVRASDDLPKIVGAKVVSRLITLPDPAVLRVGVSPDRRYAYVVASDVVRQAEVDGQHSSNVALNSRLYIFDLNHPARPVSSGSVKLSDFSSDFGTWVGDRLCFHVGKTDHDEDATIVFDVRQPLQPKLTATTAELSGVDAAIPADCVGFPRRMPASIGRSFNTTIDGEHLVVTDRYESSELTVGRNGLEVWQANQGVLPVRRAWVTWRGGVGIEHRFLASAKTLVSGILCRSEADNRLRYSVVVLAYSKPPLDWPHLLAAHRALLASYTAGQDTAANDSLASQLADAGATDLLDGTPNPERRASTVRVLNDWGFWLSRGTNPATSIPVLQKVVSIQPDRIVAWRNLVDAVRATLPSATSRAEHTRLDRIARDAQAKIRALSGKR